MYYTLKMDTQILYTQLVKIFGLAPELDTHGPVTFGWTWYVDCRHEICTGCHEIEVIAFQRQFPQITVAKWLCHIPSNPFNNYKDFDTVEAILGYIREILKQIENIDIRSKLQCFRCGSSQSRVGGR